MGDGRRFGLRAWLPSLFAHNSFFTLARGRVYAARAQPLRHLYARRAFLPHSICHYRGGVVAVWFNLQAFPAPSHAVTACLGRDILSSACSLHSAQRLWFTLASHYRGACVGSIASASRTLVIYQCHLYQTVRLDERCCLLCRLPYLRNLPFFWILRHHPPSGCYHRLPHTCPAVCLPIPSTYRGVRAFTLRGSHGCTLLARATRDITRTTPYFAFTPHFTVALYAHCTTPF